MYFLMELKKLFNLRRNNFPNDLLFLKKESLTYDLALLLLFNL